MKQKKPVGTNRTNLNPEKPSTPKKRAVKSAPAEKVAEEEFEIEESAELEEVYSEPDEVIVEDGQVQKSPAKTTINKWLLAIIVALVVLCSYLACNRNTPDSTGDSVRQGQVIDSTLQDTLAKNEFFIDSLKKENEKIKEEVEKIPAERKKKQVGREPLKKK